MSTLKTVITGKEKRAFFLTRIERKRMLRDAKFLSRLIKYHEVKGCFDNTKLGKNLAKYCEASKR